MAKTQFPCLGELRRTSGMFLSWFKSWVDWLLWRKFSFLFHLLSFSCISSFSWGFRYYFLFDMIFSFSLQNQQKYHVIGNVDQINILCLNPLSKFKNIPFVACFYYKKYILYGSAPCIFEPNIGQDNKGSLTNLKSRLKLHPRSIFMAGSLDVKLL